MVWPIWPAFFVLGFGAKSPGNNEVLFCFSLPLFLLQKPRGEWLLWSPEDLGISGPLVIIPSNSTLSWAQPLTLSIALTCILLSWYIESSQKKKIKEKKKECQFSPLSLYHDKKKERYCSIVSNCIFFSYLKKWLIQYKVSRTPVCMKRQNPTRCLLMLSALKKTHASPSK